MLTFIMIEGIINLFYCNIALFSLFQSLEVPFLGNLPLFVVFLIGLVILIIAWKLVKFAIKIVLIIAVFFIVLIGLDIIGVFSAIQNFLFSIA